MSDVVTSITMGRHSNTTMAEPTAPRQTRPHSRTLDAAQEVIRVLGLRGGDRGPPPEDADADSDLEMIPGTQAGSAPAGPTPPAGGVPALCPSRKRGHCTGEGWCPRQHPRPGHNDGALPTVGHAGARAALRYGEAQGWILDETTRGIVNIQEAVDRVAHWPGRGGPAHPESPWPTSGGDRRGAHWNGAGPSSRHGPRGDPRIPRAARGPAVDHPGVEPPTGVVLLHMGSACRHVAPGTVGTPQQAPRRKLPGTSTPGRPTRTFPGAGPRAVSQWRPRQRGSASRRPSSDTPTGQARFRPPCPTPGGGGTRGHNRYRTPRSSRCVTCPQAAWPMQPRPPGQLSHRPDPPASPCSADCRQGRPGCRGKRRMGVRARISDWCRARRCFTPRTWERWKWGAIVPNTACRWITAAAPQPMQSPPACHRLLRAPPSWPPATPSHWKSGGPTRATPGSGWQPRVHGTRQGRYSSSSRAHARGPPRPAQGVGPYGTAHRRGARPGAGTPTGARRPTSRLQARPTAWPAWDFRALLRPHTREAWWNSGRQSTTRPPRRATGTCTNSSSSLGQPWSTAGRTRTTRIRSAWAGRASGSRPRPPSYRSRALRHCSWAPARQDHHGAPRGKQQRGRSRAGPHELRGGGLDGGLHAPFPGHRGN